MSPTESLMEGNVCMAKLVEQAERYKELVEFMKKVAKTASFGLTNSALPHTLRQPSAKALFISSFKSRSMGYLQQAREIQVKKKVEEALRSKMKQKALKECDHYTSRYAQCAVGRTLSVVWQCRKQAKELNDCLHQYTNDSVLEAMKKEYMLQQNSEASAGI